MADSLLEIPEQLGLIPQLRIRGFKKPRRGRTPSRVVPRGHNTQALSNELGGGVTRRSGSLQRPHILLVKTNRRGNESCHTLTIHRTTREGHLEPMSASPK